MGMDDNGKRGYKVGNDEEGAFGPRPFEQLSLFLFSLPARPG